MQKEGAAAAGPDVNIERREGKGAGGQQEEGGEGARGGEAGGCSVMEGVCGVDTDPAKKGKLSNFVRFSCSNCDKLWG